MQIRLYFDEDTMDSDVVSALRVRGVDATTAYDSALINSSDERQLEYAAANQRVLYSFNVSDYMALHVAYMSAGKHHAGLILAQTTTVQCRRTDAPFAPCSTDEARGRYA